MCMCIFMGACVVRVCECECECVCACIKMRSSLLYNLEFQFTLAHCVRRTASSPHMILCTMYIVQAVKYLFTSEFSVLWPFKTQDNQKHEDIQWIGVIVEKWCIFTFTLTFPALSQWTKNVLKSAGSSVEFSFKLISTYISKSYVYL